MHAALAELIAELKKHRKAHSRNHLPWRGAGDPYAILVSEVMLQQTQVERVIPFYHSFLKYFPTVETLGRASLGEVLQAWQGLGYNRRAKLLRDAARVIIKNGGMFPTSAQDLEKLPGVGPYTARAVMTFAYNASEIFIETNIRTVFLHHCFVRKRAVPDKEILPLVAKALQRSRMEPRDFYASLMDYGSHLKQQGINLNRKSKHYALQSAFKGSRRQLRGELLRLLLQKPLTIQELEKTCGRRVGEVREELQRLTKEQLVVSHRGQFSVSS